MTTGDCGNRWSLGICGVEPDDRKNAPLKKPGNAKHQDVDRGAADNLIRFEPDTTQRIDRRDKKSCNHAAEQTDPRARVAHSEFRVSCVSNSGGSESTGEHLSFERDIDDTGSL